MKKNKIILLILGVLLSTSVMSCSKENEDENAENQNQENRTQENQENQENQEQPSNSEGKITDWKDGYITFYGQPESNDSYPYPLPEMEKGYYNVAVGVYFFPNYILGSAYEIKYGDKTIRVIGKDICPDGDNSWFDNTPEGFEYLTGDKSLGKVNVKWREIPYYTDKNLVFKIKSGSNNWFLGAYIFNGRYGVAKVELSKDGKQFYEMKPYQYNMFWELQCPFDQYTSDLTIRVTDRYGHIVTSVMKLNKIEDGKSYDLGANFEY